MGKHFSEERFFAAYLVVDASTAIYQNGAFLKEATPFAGLDSRLAGWFRIGSQCQCQCRFKLSTDRLQAAPLAGSLGVP